MGARRFAPISTMLTYKPQREVVLGVRLENGKYPTLSLFFVQIASRVYGDS